MTQAQQSALYGPVAEDLILVEDLLESVKRVDLAPLRLMLDHALAPRGKRLRPALVLLAASVRFARRPTCGAPSSSSSSSLTFPARCCCAGRPRFFGLPRGAPAGARAAGAAANAAAAARCAMV